MAPIADIIIGAVALVHVWFLVLEMFFWRKPLGIRTFGMTQQTADASATLAANQGLYNGFLAAGLVWGLLSVSLPVKAFFLVCILTAGVFGGLTAKRSILYVQALPAALGLILLWLAR
jgi:putative membrane protein